MSREATHHVRLLGAGAVLGPHAGIYAAQKDALEAARQAMRESGMWPGEEVLRHVIDSYLQTMVEHEKAHDPVELALAHDDPRLGDREDGLR
jgi:hypothetical protein